MAGCITIYSTFCTTAHSLLTNVVCYITILLLTNTAVMDKLKIYYTKGIIKTIAIELVYYII